MVVCYFLYGEKHMGIYLNPGNETFAQMSSDPYYVDKTGMLAVLNDFIDKGNKYICISRPRRFGKTVTGNMISAYYSKKCDSSQLFSRLKISSGPGYEEKRNKYNVIKIDMNSEYQGAVIKEKLISRLTMKIKRELSREFPNVKLTEEDSLAESLVEIYAVTGETFIILIDEYDVMVREKVEEKLFLEYLSFLNGLFKSDTLRPAISLAYLTGILPVVRDKIQSKLNNFEEYTMLDALELTEYVGFTSEEVKTLCAKHGVEYQECKNWYDGYHQNGYEIYNPQSVVKLVSTKKFRNYWGMTSSYQVIADRIKANFKGIKDDIIKMLSGESVDVNVTRYINTMDSFVDKADVFTYLIHLGYLAFNIEDGTCRIPNREIRTEWVNAISANSEYEVTNHIIESSKELLKETLAGNENAVAQALDASHIHVTSNRSYNNEDALASAIYLAYLYALNEYTAIKEVTAGKGFADVVYIPLDASKTALVIELKRNDSAESGIEQITSKRYFDCLSQYKGNLLLVGINYDEQTKTHEAKIEKYRK